MRQRLYAAKRIPWCIKDLIYDRWMDPSYRDTYEQFFQQYQLFRYAHRPDRQYRYANPVLAFLFSHTVSRPIQKMEEQMMYSKSIPENLEVDEECEDEITNLKRTYNNLLNSIRKLLERTKEEEKIIRKNELDLILEQINPHFLYNTLDVISGLTLIGDQDKSFQMTQALGRFYRNSLNSGCQVITVREELDIIKSYMTIINIRYNNEISIEYKVDENLLDILMLKLILQPLVENAVHHGMRQKEGKGELCISVQALDDKLMEVSVRDNGVGFRRIRSG